MKFNSNDPFPHILKTEVEFAIRKLKDGKSPGPDRINAEMLKSGIDVLARPLTDLFNEWIIAEQIPDEFANSTISLIFKKGDILDITNYRPIALLNLIYKVFTATIDNRIEQTLSANQPCEQAGFRKNYSTLDHSFVLNELISRSAEYNFDLYLIFIDYSKAFDSIEYGAVWQALSRQGVHSKIVNVLRNIYSKAQVFVKLGSEKVPINIGRGVRQGDPLSPHLFNAVLQDCLSTVNWENYGININGRRLNHLRYADDLVLISHSAKEVQKMLNDLCNASKTVGLLINRKKTVAMSNRIQEPLFTESQRITYVESFIYLGVRIFFDQDLMLEINRRIGSAWRGFNRFYEFLTNRRVEMAFKARVYRMCVVPALLYGSEIWSPTKKINNRLVVCQRSMMRKMCGVTRMDRRSNEWLNLKVPIHDIRILAMERKFKFAERIANCDDERWTKLVMEWSPYDNRRLQGRPKTRWRDIFAKELGVDWGRICRTDPLTWKNAIVQQARTLIIG